MTRANPGKIGILSYYAASEPTSLLVGQLLPNINFLNAEAYWFEAFEAFEGLKTRRRTRGGKKKLHYVGTAS
ncbi:hypothetical protein Hte_005531 [Hypoxylon texense]